MADVAEADTAPSGDCGFFSLLGLRQSFLDAHYITEMRALRERVVEQARACSDARLVRSLWLESDGGLADAELLVQWQTHVQCYCSSAEYDPDDATRWTQASPIDAWLNMPELGHFVALVLQADVVCLIAAELYPDATMVYTSSLIGNTFCRRFSWATQLVPRLRWQFWVDALRAAVGCRPAVQGALDYAIPAFPTADFNDAVALAAGGEQSQGVRVALCALLGEEPSASGTVSSCLLAWLEELPRPAALPQPHGSTPRLVVITHERSHFQFLASLHSSLGCTPSVRRLPAAPARRDWSRACPAARPLNVGFSADAVTPRAIIPCRCAAYHRTVDGPISALISLKAPPEQLRLVRRSMHRMSRASASRALRRGTST